MKNYDLLTYAGNLVNFTKINIDLDRKVNKNFESSILKTTECYLNIFNG